MVAGGGGGVKNKQQNNRPPLSSSHLSGSIHQESSWIRIRPSTFPLCTRVRPNPNQNSQGRHMIAGPGGIHLLNGGV